MSKEAIQDFLRYYQTSFDTGKDNPSDNTMRNVVKALRYRFVQCEEHPINMIPGWKGSTLVNKHVAYSQEEMAVIRAACQDNPEMSLAVELLYEMAGRVQDIALLHWKAITEIKSGKMAGYANVYLKKLKSTDRDVQITPDTLVKLKYFKEHVRKEAGWPDSKVFETPNAHAFKKKMIRFFEKKEGIPQFQTHNFRATRITDLYNQTKDLDTVSKWVGHRSIRTTSDYIKTDAEKARNEFAMMLHDAGNR